MKKLLKYLTLIALTLIVSISCNYDATSFDMLTKAPDASATYYVSFTDAAKSLETSVSLAGDLVDIKTTVAVTLLGLPQTSDVSVNLALDPSSTMTADMFTLSASSITIPAGETSGSVDLTTIASKMPVGLTQKFVLVIDAGAHNSPNPNATKLTYNLKRIQFCPLVNGVNDLVGSWSGTDGQDGTYGGLYSSNITTSVNGTQLKVNGIGVQWIQDWWGESVIEGGFVNMDVAGNGFVTIPRQHAFTTDWKGDSFRYDIKGSGKWDNCGGKPHITITYDIYYEGASDGLLNAYAGYFYGNGFAFADLTLN